MRYAFAAFFTALALVLGGCAHGCTDDGPVSATVVLFDVSQSTGDPQTRARFAEGFERIRDFLNENGGAIAVDVIDANPLAHSDPEAAEVPRANFNTNELEHKRKVEHALSPVSARAHDIISGTRSNAGTAILDSLRLAERFFANYEDVEDKYLVLFSDMVEESDRMRFTNAALEPDAVRAFIEAEREAHRLPDLSEVTVYVAGAGPTTGNETPPEKIRAIEDFWRAYVDATGAELSLANYGAELIAFP